MPTSVITGDCSVGLLHAGALSFAPAVSFSCGAEFLRARSVPAYLKVNASINRSLITAAENGVEMGQTTQAGVLLFC